MSTYSIKISIKHKTQNIFSSVSNRTFELQLNLSKMWAIICYYYYSLEQGVFPSVWKNTLVFPLLKKDGLEPIFKNYRPVSNLQFISKLTESAVAKQPKHHINMNKLFPSLQSSYRKFHSTESALLKVKTDILLNMNRQHVTLLVLLDLSAAFDTIDHGILLERLRSAFGVRDTALSQFASHLSGRTQQVSIDCTLLTKFDLECGVPGTGVSVCCLCQQDI